VHAAERNREVLLLVLVAPPMLPHLMETQKVPEQVQGGRYQLGQHSLNKDTIELKQTHIHTNKTHVKNENDFGPKSSKM
jgi:hypothetical protein